MKDSSILITLWDGTSPELLMSTGNFLAVVFVHKLVTHFFIENKILKTRKESITNFYLLIKYDQYDELYIVFDLALNFSFNS